MNAGVYLKASGAEPAPPHNRCHVQERPNHESPESVVGKAIEWFAMRADIEALTKLHNGGRLLGKGLVSKEVINAIAV